jgi:Tfp pilus assembly protein PilX
MNLPHRPLRLLRAQDGFTMIIAIGVMFVTGLLLVAAFTVANGDVHTSQRATLEKQAYYAALAGVQQYESQLQSEPNYWQTCKNVENTVPEQASETYVVKPVPATGQSSCNAESPFTSMIESKGTMANTFRIRSTGYAGQKGSHSQGAERTIIASFGVSGFLEYVYYTNYETKDPGLYEAENPTLAAECREKYYVKWSKTNPNCEKASINFVSGDSIEGPMHTNDAALVSGGATFGRKGHEPKDTVEINGGTYGSQSGCKSSATYYTATGCYVTTGPTLTPPPTDTSLEFYVEESNRLAGQTKLELKGKEIAVTTYTYNSGTKKWSEVKKTIAWPANGLIYVQPNESAAGGCTSFTFEVESSDTAKELEETRCMANVYVHGVYEKSLTVASAGDVIIDGSTYPSSVSGKLASSGAVATKPTGTAVLGLVANNYVRIYHPCSGGTNQSGYLADPWIYAGMLATQHSLIVDNSGCGAGMGNLNIYGAIGQNYRGVVGRSGGAGYVKNYEYDDRLATSEPPYFLTPLKAGWKIVRQTAQSPG